MRAGVARDGGVAAAAEGEVQTRVRIAYDARGSTAPNYDVAVFLGTVRADKKPCRSGRKVSVSTVSGQSVGSAKRATAASSRSTRSGFGPGNYVVKVHKKKAGKLHLPADHEELQGQRAAGHDGATSRGPAPPGPAS